MVKRTKTKNQAEEVRKKGEGNKESRVISLEGTKETSLMRLMR